MPWKVRKRGKGKKPYKIIGPGGKVVGSSTSRKKARASVRARYASKHGQRRRRRARAAARPRRR